MLYEILITLFSFFTILLIIVVLVQKSHGGFWSGPASQDSTIIFGGSGGSDIFQKITWFLGVIFLLGSLGLSIYKSKNIFKNKYNYEKKEVKKELNNKEEVSADLNNLEKEAEKDLNKDNLENKKN